MMNTQTMIEILKAAMRIKGTAQITVSGFSMLPILENGQLINIISKDDFTIGDILVFSYNPSELLVHRLLKIKNDKLYCKGDNCYRLEEITKEQIIGSVEIDCDNHNNADFIKASLDLNKVALEYNYNLNEIHKTQTYIDYKNTYLQGVSECG